jgi:hypothetical protein
MKVVHECITSITSSTDDELILNLCSPFVFFANGRRARVFFFADVRTIPEWPWTASFLSCASLTTP